MKAAFEDVESRRGDASFVAYHLQVPAFPFKWHYHPEYELTLISRGAGRRLVGDNEAAFAAGDLVLLGPGLPHTWASGRSSRAGARAVVIQFDERFAASFLQWPESAKLATMLTASVRGLHFPARKVRPVAAAIEALPTLQGIERTLALVRILDLLAAQKPQPLASPYFTTAKGRETERRINKVCGHIHRHAAEPLTLATAAALIHLSPSAFCRFFKRVTGKTFSDYVNDVRIGHACSLLSGTDGSVAEAAFASGFESLTYFNRVFARKKGLSPRAYRARMATINEHV
ncbi:MAG: AraC family transcriptional regulator [Chitinophagaceae bacterium]|nr:MAG: AraC family transcriptional regulator [Chitinophagaceae bacterium]